MTHFYMYIVGVSILASLDSSWAKIHPHLLLRFLSGKKKAAVKYDITRRNWPHMWVISVQYQCNCSSFVRLGHTVLRGSPIGKLMMDLKLVVLNQTGCETSQMYGRIRTLRSFKAHSQRSKRKFFLDVCRLLWSFSLSLSFCLMWTGP